MVRGSCDQCFLKYEMIEGLDMQEESGERFVGKDRRLHILGAFDTTRLTSEMVWSTVEPTDGRIRIPRVLNWSTWA